MIKVTNVSKRYSYYQKQKGIKGSIKNLFKREKLYKDAVKCLNMTISPGDIVGFIGLNGAGKTTTLKMLSGILKPTSGTIEILGHEPFSKNYEFLKQITMVLGSKSQLLWDLPPIETFELNRRVYEIDKQKYNDILEELIEILKVKHLLNVQVRMLSLGERMKMEFIAGLIHSPSIVFLDEPTIGLDIISQYNIREFLRAYNKKYNSTILLTSHNFDDIVYLCNRLMLIDNGEIIYDKPFESFIKEHSNQKILTLKCPENSDTLFNELSRKNIKILEVTEGQIKISIEKEEIIDIVLNLVNNYYEHLHDISIENIDIKDIIKNIYSKS